MLSEVEFIEIKRGGKRVIDIEAHLYARSELAKEMKASHKRSSTLQLRRQSRGHLAKEQKAKSKPK